MKGKNRQTMKETEPRAALSQTIAADLWLRDFLAFIVEH